VYSKCGPGSALRESSMRRREPARAWCTSLWVRGVRFVSVWLVFGYLGMVMGDCLPGADWRVAAV
jgi:hypothetical protein